MQGWKPIWRWLTASVVFAVLVAVAVVVFGPNGSGQTAAAPPAKTARPTQPSAAPTDDDALVNRMLDQLRAGKPVEPQFAAGDNPAAGVPIEAIKARPGEQLRLGRLEIPRLKVDQPLNNGVDEAALVQGVGHWPGTPLPGSPGNSVISGHRSTHEKPFLYLDRLRPGDPIIATVGATRTTYKVAKVVIVPQAQYVKFVLKQPTRPGEKDITLFACNPITAHYQRIVVQATAA
ncbi:class E sortase [Kribbella jiaozuonensis]|uniref:Class E sortase n=1 Tax=Kribbella jiaozuonensis TaxID=2575441 RepID=A0A4U3LKK8_9ACTN|nr:class E sortase [Kribbella jiaozuonensis]TKK76120.1 class E sortase [Kribbella jiaozuonensis]